MANEIKIGADISGLSRELARIDGITEKEAKKMVKALDRQMKRAERSTKKAAKASQKAWSKAGQGIGSSLDRIVPGMGRLHGGMLKLGERAGMSASAVNKSGVAIGGLALVAAAGAVAMFKLANSASEYVDKISILATKTGLAADTVIALEFAAKEGGGSFEVMKSGLDGLGAKLVGVSNGSAEAVRAFSMIGVSATNVDGSLRPTEDILSDTLLAISLLPTEAEKAAAGLNLFGGAGADLVATLGTGGVLLDEWRIKTAGMIDEKALSSSAAMDKALNDLDFTFRRLSLSLGTDFAPELLKALELTDRAVVSFNRLARMTAGGWQAWIEMANAAMSGDDIMAAGQASVQASKKMILASEAAATAAATATDAETAAREERIKAIKIAQEAAAADRKRAMAAAANAKTEAAAKKAATDATRLLREEEAKRAAAAAKDEAARRANFSELQTNSKGLVASIRQSEAATTSAEDKILQVTLDRYAKIAELEQGHPELAAQAAAARVALEADTTRQIAELNTATATAQREALMTSASQTAGALSDLTSTLASASEKHEGLAIGMFRASQAAGLAQVGIDTAAAISKGMAMFGPPPSPLGIAAIAAATATGAASVATIVTQSPPSFHTGGLVPDERMIRARAGEGVLTPQGVAAIGGRAGLDRMNTGRAGAGQQITVIQQYRHRVFDAIVQDSLKMTNSPLRQAITGAARVGHSGRQ